MNKQLYKHELKDVQHIEYLEQLCDEIGVRIKTEEVQNNNGFWFSTEEEYFLESSDINKINYILFEYNKYEKSYNYAKQLEDECVLKKDTNFKNNIDALMYSSKVATGLDYKMYEEFIENGWNFEIKNNKKHISKWNSFWNRNK